MAAIIQIYQPISALVLEDGTMRSASDMEIRRMFPDAPNEVLRYEAVFPECIRELCKLVVCDDKTLEDVIWGIEDDKNVAVYLPYWTTALLYTRENRTTLRADKSYGQRGNYDTLLFALYRLCWEATLCLCAFVRKR